MILQKVEIRFEKGEALRFISHHDLMRALTRALRRAALPLRLTQGFNPRPRLVFPVALEVGVISLDEVAEIELIQCLDIQEIASRLSSVFPPGLVLKKVAPLPPLRAGQTAQRIRYRLHLTQAQLTLPPQSLEKLLQAPSLPFLRPREKGPQKVDLRAALLHLELEHDGNLLIDVRPAPQGSARPLELLSLLLQRPLTQLRHVKVVKLQMDLAQAPLPQAQPSRPPQPPTLSPPPQSSQLPPNEN